jgi:type I restriction-modification system DNA methylase subunit
LLRRSASRNDLIKKVSEIKILDPACGSGSFLLGAFQYLLDWHLKYYTSSEETIKKYSETKRQPIYRNDRGNYLLTTSEKKRILLNNIYGVDIDQQAVEVTKLSLMLKVLEGESTETLSNELKFFRERALPDLSNNIKCGNSLIGPDFYDQPVSANPRFDGMEMNFLDDEEKLRINVFDWKKEFPDIFGHSERSEESQGFDVVIGNPPYGMRLIYSEVEKEYFKANYNSSKGSYENYFLFYEASLRVLNKNGKHGFIVPITWLTIPSAESLRKYVLHNYSIERIVWLPELVFKNAQVNTLVSIISNDKTENVEVYIFNTTDINSDNHVYKNFKQDDFIRNNDKIDIFVNSGESEIFEKIKKISVSLGDVAYPCSGYNPYEVGKGIAPNGKLHTKETVETKPYHSNYKVDDSWKPEIIGHDLKRYFLKISGDRWIKYGKWLAASRDPDNFQGKRILVQEITGGKDRRIIAVYYDEELYHSRDVIPIKCNNKEYHPFYLLGVLNSSLMSWLHRKQNPKSQKGLFPKVLVSDLKKSRVPKINNSNKVLVDKIIQNVNSIIKLHQSLDITKIPQEKTALERQIAATDKQIDQLVYKLYGLTEEEIKIVEMN